MYDLKQIQGKFNEVIQYSQGISEPKTDALFDKWLENKRDFIEVFGGELIYEFPQKVNFELGPKEKGVRVDEFILALQERYDNYELAIFVEKMKEGFFANEVLFDYILPDGRKIAKGMKLVKAFKLFEEDKSLLTDIQNHASRIIQEDKIEGTLCLSVHPLDFLSTSENDSNWRSCHSLDGEYRAGNLSYMVDKSTIICYLKSNTPAQLPNFPGGELWNNKKWRVLLYFADRWDMIFAGRQYPFATKSGLDFVLNNLVKHQLLGKQSYWSDWSNVKILSYIKNGEPYGLSYKYIPYEGELIKMEGMIVENESPLHFNDLLNSSCYDAEYTFFEGRGLRPFGEPDYFPTFHIGGDVPCLECGRHQITPGQDTMRCEGCELEYGTSENDMFGYCAWCGSRMLVDDAYYIGEDMLCHSCFQAQEAQCEKCGGSFYKEDVSYNRETEQYLCEFCTNEVNSSYNRTEEI